MSYLSVSTVTFETTSVVSGDVSETTSHSGTFDAEEDTVTLTHPRDKAPPTGVSVPPLLGLLLLDDDGDSDLLPGALLPSVLGVVFGENGTTTNVNTTISSQSPPPSVLVSTYVTSTGEVIPLELEDLSKVSVLPVDTDSDGKIDVVLLGVFVDEEEEPKALYVIDVANSTSTPEEGYLSTVNVSKENIGDKITITLYLSEKSPLGELDCCFNQYISTHCTHRAWYREDRFMIHTIFLFVIFFTVDALKYRLCCAYSKLLYWLGKNCTILPSICPLQSKNCCPSVVSGELPFCACMIDYPVIRHTL